MYLYIIIEKHDQYLKIGRAKSKKRIKESIKLYNCNIETSLYLTDVLENIYTLENSLKKLTKDKTYIITEKLSGSSELRNIETLDKIIEYCNNNGFLLKPFSKEIKKYINKNNSKK